MWARSSPNGRASPRDFGINLASNLASASPAHDGDDVMARLRPLVAKHDIGWRVEFNAIASGEFMARRRAMNSPLAIALNSTRHPMSCFATRGRSLAITSSPSCAGEAEARLDARLIPKSRGLALPFGELRAHIRVKPQIEATTAAG